MKPSIVTSLDLRLAAIEPPRHVRADLESATVPGSVVASMDIPVGELSRKQLEDLATRFREDLYRAAGKSAAAVVVPRLKLSDP